MVTEGGGGQLRGQSHDHVARLTRLLDFARAGESGDGASVRRLLTWLAGTLGGTVTLTGQGGEPLTGPASRAEAAAHRELAARAGELLGQVAGGRLHAAAVDDHHGQLRLVALGRRTPHPVLAAALPRPFDEQDAALLGQAAAVLALLLKAREAEEHRRNAERATECLRLAVFQLLMGGDVALAQRTAAGLSPGLLDADTARVYVLELPEHRRELLVRACEAATGERALAVRCAAYDSQLIVVAPTTRRGGPEHGAGHGPGHDAGDHDVAAALHRIVEERPGVFLGAGGLHPLAQLADAYGEAARALAVARYRPGRVAEHLPQTRLTALLDPAASGAWAARVLQPLDSLPHHGRGPLLATVSLGLEFTAVNAAKILGISRNTVRARMDRTAALLGADLADVRARAALHLALQMSHAAPAPAADDGAPPAGLERLLAAGPVRDWARELLGRLAAADRDLRRTLRTWIAENTAVEETAARLGVHPRTVRDHLRGAEQLLGRRLVPGGGDLYEVVLACAALEDVDLGSRPGCVMCAA
ncbi:PucR family transcriptional regulator [Streptomyces rectiverticillatus]|uniref:helix-turn-helix domain-containing protein n=1 Tax=Streptomyces rectiverticillatus TaxID=173860 RepID=UPI0015C3BC68|nr:helix-turn-helix domain-containing protein [Streptomyces rectiverticillatus]QLE75517.1 PucR family transcriptional regulator [Streptomyces rectiverticillatus]